MNQFEKRQEKYERSKVNGGVTQVTENAETREPPVKHTHVGSQGEDFLTEGLE